jgi:hypothetical protein
MQPTNPSDDEQTSPQKIWHAPQCTKKTWQTPQFVAIAFKNTNSGVVTGFEHSGGSTAS